MHTATCQCGQLTAEMKDHPEFVLVCTCKQCQKRGGSAFAYGAFFPRTSLSTNGTVKTWTRPAQDGRTLTNHFCPDCGTTVFWAPEVRPDHFGVAVGCMDTEVPEPNLAIWLEEAHPWVRFPHMWTQFPQAMPR